LTLARTCRTGKQSKAKLKYCSKARQKKQSTIMSKSPSLRRIQADIRELALDPSDRYSAHPMEDDMFEW